MRAAQSQLARLQKETLPACPEDPLGPSGLPSPLLLSLLSQCVVICCLCFVLAHVTCLNETGESWPQGPSSLLPAALPSLYGRADIKPKTREGMEAVNLSPMSEEGLIHQFIFLGLFVFWF